MKIKMYENREIGKWGESIAANFLEQNSYKIIDRNFRCKQGEIDIVAKNKEYIIFIEVKTRSYIFFGNPGEAVDKRKKKNIYHAAKYFLHINKLEECFVRFDIIEVFIKKNYFKINHIKQVW